MGLLVDEPPIPSLLLLGPVALLLVLGMLLRVATSSLRAIPHSVLAGAVAAAAYGIPDLGLKDAAGDLSGLDLSVLNALMFCALVLGFGSPSTRGLRREARALAGSPLELKQSTLPSLLHIDGSLRWRIGQWVSRLWHLAVPQVVYSQTLAWAQVALAIAVVAAAGGHEGLGASVAVGLDVGFESIQAAETLEDFPSAVLFAQTADSCGIIIGLSVGLFLVWSRLSEHGKGLQLSWPRRVVRKGVDSESFVRGGDLGGAGAAKLRSRSADMAADPDWARPSLQTDGGRSSAGAAPARDLPVLLQTNTAQWTKGEQSMELHLVVLAAGVFFGYLLLRGVSFVDSAWLQLVLGYRLFPLCMLVGIVMIHVSAQNDLGLNKSWFHRFSGVCLSVMIVVLLATLAFPAARNGGGDDWADNRLPFALAVTACALFQVFAYVVLAPFLFPRFWPERGIAELGHCLGDAWLGLLLVKTMDPALQTPAPRTYVYRLLIVPFSDATRALLVLRMTKHLGALYTGLIALGVSLLWLGFYLVWYRKQWAGDGSLAAKTKETKKNNKKESTDELADQLLPGGGEEGRKEREREQEEEEEPLPRLVGGDSSLLTEDGVRLIAGALSPTLRLRDWHMLYSLQQHGASLNTLFGRCAASSAAGTPAIIVIQDSWGYVLGGFASEGFRTAPSYYGTGESFVFRLSGVPRVYRQTGANSMYVYGTAKAMGMGGGSGGFAFFLDEELDNGTSAKDCETFGSDCLASSSYFSCVNVEVWGLQ